VFDVETTAQAAADEAADWCSYAELGERFFDLVLTAERVAGTLARLEGKPLEIGPVAAGPGKIARVTVTGQIGAASAVRVDGEPLHFRVSLPMEIDLLVQLPGQEARFHGAVTVGVDLSARAARPLRVVFDVRAPEPEDVEVDLVADGVRAGLLRAAAGLDEEMKRYVARYVGTELDKPKAVAARDLDVLRLVEKVWT
jgi:hypothetical protein